MTEPRFLQLHTLHTYTGALLNRDDTGLAKRLPYGGSVRTRISSQCLKRHWSHACDPHALTTIDGAPAAFRSRELVTRRVIEELQGDGVDDDSRKIIGDGFQMAVYGDKAAGSVSKRQTLLLGKPELDWLLSEARKLADEHGGDQEQLQAAVDSWRGEFRGNIKVLREQTLLPGGITAALFGRMVTSDPAANIDAPVHVAHAFTVHGEESESDYFTAVDDLKDDDSDGGADTIQETELTCGLYYGYVVIDVPLLVSNTTAHDIGDWLKADRSLAGQIVHHLMYLIAEVSPGAKLGSTAPYGRAEFMLAEFGDRQPRSLAGAFRTDVAPTVSAACKHLGHYLNAVDHNYATGEVRRMMSLDNADFANIERQTLPQMAQWAQHTITEGQAT